MKTKLIALATAATIALGAAAPMANAMGAELNMLTGAVFKELQQRGLPTDNILDLSLSQIVEIKAITEGDESTGNQNIAIKSVLDGAGNR